jgi:hypothetical protein
VLDTITPNSTPKDVNGVVEIIKLLSDADAYSKRLTEITTALGKYNAEALKAHQEGREKVRAMLAEFGPMLEQSKQRQIELDAREARLDAREQSVAAREKMLREFAAQGDFL